MNFKTFLIHDLWFFIKYFNIVQQRERNKRFIQMA